MALLRSILQRIVKRSEEKPATNLPLLVPEVNYLGIPGNELQYQGLLSKEKIIEERQKQLKSTPFLANTFHLEEYFEPEPGYETTGARILGRGNYGQAILYRFKFYNVPDESLTPDQVRIKQLCDEDGLIVVKRELNGQGGISASEIEITSYLVNHPGNYNKTLPATIVNENGTSEAIILSHYACFQKNPAAVKPKSHNKSYSLKGFLQKMHDAAIGVSGKTNTTAVNAYRNVAADFSIIFAQLGSAMMGSIRSLHAVGVYHLDIALRNFLMGRAQLDEKGQIKKFNLLAADFGEAKQYDLQTNLTYENIKDTGPLRWLDLATVLKSNTQKYTARADLYAFRVSLISMLAIDLGYEECDPIFIRLGESAIYNVHNRISTCNGRDANALERYLANLKDLLNKKVQLQSIRQADMQALQTALAERTTHPKMSIAQLSQQKSTWQVNKAEWLTVIKENDKIITELQNKQNEIINALANSRPGINMVELEKQREDLAETLAAYRSQRKEQLDLWYWYDKLDQLLDDNIHEFAKVFSQGTTELISVEWAAHFETAEQQINAFIKPLLDQEAAAIQRVQNYIECYGDYIVQTSWEGFAAQEADIKKVDYQQFLAANEKFFIKTVWEKIQNLRIDNIDQLNAFKLSLTRLFELGVSSEFKEFNLYQALANYLAGPDLQALNIEQLKQHCQLAEQAITNLDRQKDFVSLAVPDVEPERPMEHLHEEPVANLVAENTLSKPVDLIAEGPHTLEQTTLIKLAERLDKLNQILITQSQYYESAFYSVLNPLRHRFIKTQHEVFANLPYIKQALYDEMALLKQHAGLLQLYRKDNKKIYRSAKRAVDRATKEALKDIDLKVRSLRKKYSNYQQYLLLVMQNFASRLQKLSKKDYGEFAVLEHEFAEFKQALLSYEIMQRYDLWLGLEQVNINSRAEQLAAKIQQKAQEYLAQAKAVDFGCHSVTIKGVASGEIQKATLKEAKELNKSVVSWCETLSQEKSWHCSPVKSNPQQILIQPKKSKLHFVMDVVDKSFTYQRNNPLASNKKLNLPKEEERIVAAMVKAFVMTGYNVAEIAGNKVLCDQVVKYLKAYHHIQQIKVNGQVVHNTLPAPAKTHKIQPSAD